MTKKRKYLRNTYDLPIKYCQYRNIENYYKKCLNLCTNFVKNNKLFYTHLAKNSKYQFKFREKKNV